MSDTTETAPKKRSRKPAAKADPSIVKADKPAKPAKPRARRAIAPVDLDAGAAALAPSLKAGELDDVFRDDDAFASSVAHTLGEDAEPEKDLATLLAAFGPAEPTRIELTAILDRNAAVALHGGLLSARNAPVEIDASKVERLGGQCAQILLSAVATWAADAQPLTLVEPSAGFERDLALLGLSVFDFQPMDLPQ